MSNRQGNWEGGLSKRDICLEFGTHGNLGRKFNVNNNIVAHEVNSQGLMLDVDAVTSMVNIISPMDDGNRIIASYDFNRLRNESIKRNPLTI